jgi:anti-anti-sigma factor
MLNIATVQRPGHVVVRISGQVLAGENAELVAGLEGLLRLPAKRLLLDCAELEYLNSRGLGDLLHFYQRLKAGGGELAVCAATPNVMKVMRAVGLDRFLQIFPTVADAERIWQG